MFHLPTPEILDELLELVERHQICYPDLFNRDDPLFPLFWNSTYVSAPVSAWYLIVNVFLVSSAMKMQYSRLIQNE